MTVYEKRPWWQDPYRRAWLGESAICGCAWVEDRTPGSTDCVLVECPIHAAATKAHIERCERTRPKPR